MDRNQRLMNQEGLQRRSAFLAADVSLSPREKQLLRRLAQGKPDQTIAAEIGGKAQQIAAQRQRLIEKLAVESQAELVAAAAQLAPWPPSKKKHSR